MAVLMRFDVKAFLKDLEKAMKTANQNIRDELIIYIKDNLREIDFKTNEVKIAGGRVTSDRDRRKALIDSIAPNGRANWITATAIRSVVSAMRTNFKDSHIGLYYEYGTGREQDLRSNYESLGQPNIPFRIPNTGAQIVTRSKKLGMGGAWVDVGGNLRTTKSPRAGQYKGIEKYIGEDIRAQHWFENAVNSPLLKNRIKSHLVKAIKAVSNLSKYFIGVVSPLGGGKFVLGRD